MQDKIGEFERLLDDVIAKASNINVFVDKSMFEKWAAELKAAAVKDFFNWKYLHDGVDYTTNTAYTFADYLRVGNYVTNLENIKKTIPSE